MYRKLSITNFRSLKKVAINNIGQINLITGGNGTGKSTLLEALFLNAGSSNGLLAVTLNALRGDDEISSKNDSVFHSLFHKHNAKCEIGIETKYQLPNSKIMTRNLRISPRLKQKLSAGETGMDAFVDGLDFKFGHKLGNAKKEKIVNGHINFDKTTDNRPFTQGKVDSALILPCRYISQMEPPMRDIPDRISNIIKAKQIDKVVRLLNIIDPRITNISTLSENGRTNVYVDIGLDRLMPATYMGGGFARMLSLAIAMIGDKIILVDEIENGLHHTTHEPLLNFIFRSATDLKRQVFLTTHSSEFLDKFISAMKDHDNLEISAYRCIRKDNDVAVNTYTKEELGLREQLDIELR